MAFEAPRTIFTSSLIIFWWMARSLNCQGAAATTQADVLQLGHIPPMKQQRSRRQHRLSARVAEESVTIIPSVLPLSCSFSSNNSITATANRYHHNQSLMQPVVLAQRCCFLCKPWGSHPRRAPVWLLAYQAHSVLFSP